MISAAELIELEKTEDLSKLTINRLWFYPVLKQTLLKNKQYKIEIELSKARKSRLILLFISNFVKHIFTPSHPKKPVDYLFFMSSADRRANFNGKAVSIYVDPLINTLPEGSKFAIFEIPNTLPPFHYSNNYSSNLFFEDKSIYKVLLQSKLKRQKIEFDFDTFNNFFNKTGNNLDINQLEEIYTKFYNYRKHYLKLLKKLSPRVVFIVCAYSVKNMALVNACHQLGIKAVELQHGYIQNSHKGYVYNHVCSKDLLPDFFLIYGEYFKINLQNISNLFSEKQLIQIGNVGLDWQYNNALGLPAAMKIQFEGKTVIAVSSQGTIGKELRSVIEAVAQTIPDKYHILYKLHPDEFHNYNAYIRLGSFKNVTVLADNKISVYDMLKEADIHCTVYSTTALEAIYFGKPNLLIQIQPFSKTMEFIEDEMNCFAKDALEFIEKLAYFDTYSKTGLIEKCRKAGEQYFAPHPEQNFLDFLDKINQL